MRKGRPSSLHLPKRWVWGPVQVWSPGPSWWGTRRGGGRPTCFRRRTFCVGREPSWWVGWPPPFRLGRESAWWVGRPALFRLGREPTRDAGPGPGADDLRWTQCQIVTGGSGLDDVKVHSRRGKLGVPEEMRLSDERIERFQHSRACTAPQLEELMCTEVDRLHQCLGRGGTLRGLPGGQPE